MPNHSLIASIANGFKAPTLQQLYLDTSGNTVDEWDTIPNADLEAETAVNMELAYEFRYGSNRLRLTWEPVANLSFTASVTNLFGEQYFQWQCIRNVGGEGAAIRGAVLGGGLNLYTEPGRAISVSASWQF